MNIILIKLDNIRKDETRKRGKERKPRGKES